MTEDERALNTVILIAIGKLYSEQSTMLTGELKQRKKQLFNNAVREVDQFVKEVEKLLQPDEIKMIENIVDEFHQVFNEIRK